MTAYPTQIALDHDAEEVEFVALDAQAAYRGISALVEILSGCQPGYQVTGIFIHTLLVDVKCHLENVVSGLRVPSVMQSVYPQQGNSIN